MNPETKTAGNTNDILEEKQTRRELSDEDLAQYIDEWYKSETFEMEKPKDPTYVPLPIGSPKVINPYCRIIKTKVKVDTNEEIFPYENMFENQKEPHFGLRKNGLFRIANAAGVRWESSELLETSSIHVIYKACASFRGMDGMFTPYYAMSELNIPAEEKKIRDRFLKMAYDYKDTKTEESIKFFENTTPEEWAMGQANLQINVLRNSKIAIAETRAKTRLIRTILGLKSGFTMRELEKGFTVERVDFRPDIHDPEVKKMFLEVGFNNQLYQLVNKKHEAVDIERLKGKKQETGAETNTSYLATNQVASNTVPPLQNQNQPRPMVPPVQNPCDGFQQPPIPQEEPMDMSYLPPIDSLLESDTILEDN